MRTYEEYRAINLPWLQQIPAHWEIRRNKNIFTEMKTEVGSNSSDYTLLSLTLNGIIPRDMNGGGKFPASFEKYKIVKKGYMAFCLFDVDETPRTVGLSQYDGMLTGAYTIMKVDNVNARFVLYYYLALDNGKLMKPLYTGLRKTININTFQSTKIPIPPRSEQDQIVRFLDWKISEINRLIALHKDSIKTLSEFMYTLIDKAVIKGLNKSEMTINNNIRWQIEYPKHWSIFRTREHFTFRKGLSITKANLVTKGIPVISYGQIHSKENTGVGLNDNLIRFVNESYLYTDSSSIVEFGDFIFADTSEDIAGCGNCVYIDWNKTIFAGYHSIIMHPDELANSKYMAYLFKSPTWRHQIRKAVNAVKVYTISQKILKDTFILLPPIEEQNAIVAHLDAECDKIHKAIELKKAQILQLQEFKTCLISDVVTGKIDVRGIEIPEYEYISEETDEMMKDKIDDTEEEFDEE